MMIVPPLPRGCADGRAGGDDAHAIENDATTKQSFTCAVVARAAAQANRRLMTDRCARSRTTRTCRENARPAPSSRASRRIRVGLPTRPAAHFHLGTNQLLIIHL